VQVKVLPISEKHLEYAQSIFNSLIENQIRAEIDIDSDTLGKKIRSAKTQKIPYLLVAGDKEVESKEVTIESRTEKGISMSIEKFLEKIQKEIKERK
jgi:threonyl-tRNA synthetase